MQSYSIVISTFQSMDKVLSCGLHFLMVLMIYLGVLIRPYMYPACRISPISFVLCATKDTGKICRQANKTPHMQEFWWEFCCDSPPVLIHATRVITTWRLELQAPKTRFKCCATAVPNSTDRIKFDFSTAVAQRLKPSRATAV